MLKGKQSIGSFAISIVVDRTNLQYVHSITLHLRCIFPSQMASYSNALVIILLLLYYETQLRLCRQRGRANRRFRYRQFSETGLIVTCRASEIADQQIYSAIAILAIILSQFNPRSKALLISFPRRSFSRKKFHCETLQLKFCCKLILKR